MITIETCNICQGSGKQRDYRCSRCWGRGTVPAGFRPSDVILRVPPLTDTMRKTEIECAAALLVATLALRGDEWRPLLWSDVQEAARACRGEKPEGPEGPEDRAASFLWDVQRNPFLRPDFPGLLAGGFATKDDSGAITFTHEGLAALAKWVCLPAQPEAAEATA